MPGWPPSGPPGRRVPAAPGYLQLRTLLESGMPVVTIVGKTWLLHVNEILRTTPEENLKMIEESVRFLVSNGREVIYNADTSLTATWTTTTMPFARWRRRPAGGPRT